MIELYRVFPQALCSRYALQIGASFAWFVKGLMVLLFIIAWPISKLLDWLLGNAHSDLFERSGTNSSFPAKKINIKNS